MHCVTPPFSSSLPNTAIAYILSSNIHFNRRSQLFIIVFRVGYYVRQSFLIISAFCWFSAGRGSSSYIRLNTVGRHNVIISKFLIISVYGKVYVGYRLISHFYIISDFRVLCGGRHFLSPLFWLFRWAHFARDAAIFFSPLENKTHSKLSLSFHLLWSLGPFLSTHS